MAVDSGLVEWVAEALEDEGTVISKRMFGGVGLYCRGLFFAMIANDLLWFKADALSDELWDEAECPRFTYDFGDGKMSGSMNYRRAPDDVYDDVDTLRHWALIALSAAERAPVKKSRK